ncbi:MAG: hypothetical protein M0Z50_02135 [Planctomycetia bacterium]|nr:hypothetical protein [Planctomycetia bacterium]
MTELPLNSAQEKAAASLRKALMACSRAHLGVYIWDGTPMVCPQPDGCDNTMWDDNPASLCTYIAVKGLDCDGGVGH